MKLSSLDHPAIFVIAIVLVVTAGQKLLGYLAAKAGQPTIHDFFVH